MQFERASRFSEKVKELMHVKNLMPDKARVHLKNTIHLI